MDRRHREIDRLLGGRDDNAGQWPFSRFSFLPGRSARSYPLLNVRETADAYHVDALAPGIDAKSLKVSVTGNQMTIEGAKSAADQEVAAEADHRGERSAGRFVRSLTLPAEIDAAKVKAEYRNGMLSIELPKAAGARPRQIAVNFN
jgi:HSP20 family protein